MKSVIAVVFLLCLWTYIGKNMMSYIGIMTKWDTGIEYCPPCLEGRTLEQKYLCNQLEPLCALPGMILCCIAEYRRPDVSTMYTTLHIAFIR